MTTPAPVISSSAVAVESGKNIQLTATVRGQTAGDLVWYVNGIPGGAAATGTISSSGLYSAPVLTAPADFDITASASRSGLVSEKTQITVLVGGQVTTTRHPLVANYSFLAPTGASTQIEFGLDANYGRTTWMQNAPTGGGQMDVLVAGMQASTPYHMRARVKLANGLLFLDDDHTFTTGSIPTDRLATLSTHTTTGKIPQPGIELVDLAGSSLPNGILAEVVDLDGNVIWYYDAPLPQQRPTLTPIKLLPNGHFLLGFNDVGPNFADGQNSVMREIDLTGKTIWEMSYLDLNNLLAAATCSGCNITIVGTHHDFTLLPNGHLIILATESRFYPSLDGFPNGTDVVGDVIIDLDQSRKPVWLWSTFDHLDPNRHLMGLPDWTHSNAIVYSPDDHNLYLSVRHQSWILKIDYRDGSGTGDVLWKLGYQGDFTLLNGSDPVDWQYAQHDFNVISPTSAGTFDALLFDNGNLRVLDSNGTACGGSVPCHSRVPILHVDEGAKIASISWVDSLVDFSFFGGSARLLPNGNVEFDECAGPASGPNAVVFEVIPTSPPQTVWQMQVSQYTYRSFRIPSLYPGIQW